MVRRRKGSGRRLPFSLADQNSSRHVRMKFAVIFNRFLGLENHRLFAVDRDQDVPGTVACRGRMCDDELFHLHLNGVGARHARRNNENERAEYLTQYRTCHSAEPYLNSAATCSACCSWPWKIFSPVVSRSLSSALLASGISVLSSAESTVLWYATSLSM